ncbi:MAG: response regulator [Rhodospirillales bacterium]|nr:response regulator [Rhodospirillales bacterium]
MNKIVKKQRILVADDDEVLMQLIEHILNQAGYTVICVGDGEHALKHAVEDHPDLIILDGMMPGMDGVEVLRQIRENPETENIPTVMLTARGMERNIVGALKLGADEYIVKPFMPGELIARINRLLENSRRS